MSSIQPGIRKAPFALVAALALAACGGGGGGDDGNGNGGGNNGGGESGISVPVTTTSGTASNGAGFTQRTFTLPATDLAWDSSRQSLYVAVPAISSVNPSTVSVLNLTTARIVSQGALPSSPLRLALTTDNQFLYVGSSVGGPVLRLSLPSLQTNQTFTLESGPSGQPYYAIQIAPMPGNAHAVAIVQGDNDSPTKGIGGISVYDDAVRRPDVLRSETIDALAWSQDAATLFATNVESSSLDFYKLAVAASGVSLSTKTAIGFNHSALHVDLVGGLLYADGGDVMEPAEAKPVGVYHGPPGLLVAPDASHPIVFRLFPDYESSDPNNNYIVQSYNRDRFTPIAFIRISGIHADLNGFPSRFIRTGDRSLAFSTARGHVFSIEGDFVASATPDVVSAPTVTTLVSDTSAEGATYTLRRLNVAASDIAWDSVRGRLHLAIPGYARVNPNTITSLDTATGQFTGSTNAGSDPTVLGMSQDQSYLYVGIAGAASVQRLRMSDRTFDSEFYLGRDPIFGAYTAKEIAVAPGFPRTAAVVRARPNDPSPEQDGVAIFDDAVQRSEVGGHLTSIIVPGGNVGYLNGPLTDSITWGADASVLYGANNETSLGDFSIYSVDPAGLHYDRNAAFVALGQHVHFSNGRIYSDEGPILDIASESDVGTIDLGFGNGTASALVTVDSGLRKLFYLQVTNLSGTQIVAYKFASFDLDTFAPIDSVTYVDLPTEKPRVEVIRFVRWGTDGLSFINRLGELYLLSGAFVDGRP